VLAFDLPMTSNESQDLRGSRSLGVKAGDDVDDLRRDFPGLLSRDLSLDSSDLPNVGESDETVQLGRGRDSTDLDPPVSLLNRLGLRGEKNPPRSSGRDLRAASAGSP
jgi:hypothetical protein